MSLRLNFLTKISSGIINKRNITALAVIIMLQFFTSRSYGLALVTTFIFAGYMYSRRVGRNKARF